MKKVILISGMSGAGKTSAMSYLEDMGYHCIDSFPVQLLENLCELIENSSDVRYENIALATSAEDYKQFLMALKGRNFAVDVLFLDASDDALLHRYKSTRRTHPLLVSNKSNSLEEAIDTEREMFENYNDNYVNVIDTTFLSAKELKRKIEKRYALKNLPSFSISFISFGFKNGVPMDADLVFDVRFLPNPFWVEELKNFSGNDECVYNYVMDNAVTKEFISKLDAFLDYAFEQYVKEGKNHFTVAIGCTGGQHRSVSITNYLYNRYSEKYTCYKEHRDNKVGNDNEN